MEPHNRSTASKDCVDEKQVVSSVKDVQVGTISDLDEAELFLRDNNITNEYVAELIEDKALNRRVVRKVDLILLPLLAGTYMLQYIDKSALAYSAVFDLLPSTR